MQAGFVFKITLYFIIMILSVALICRFCIRGRKSLALFAYISVQFMIFLWALHDILYDIYLILPYRIQYQNSYVEFIYQKSDLFITCFIPFFWLVFCMNYANPGAAKRIGLISVLGIPPVIFFYLHLTNYFDYDMPFSKATVTAVFLTYISMCYLYLLTGIVLMFGAALKQKGVLKKQAVIVSFCLILPMATSIVHNYRMYILHKEYPIFGIDLTLVSFSITMMMIALAAFRYRFLNTTPYAMKELFNHMDQPMVIADSNNSVIEINMAFATAFDTVMKVKLHDGIERLAEKLALLAEDTPERKRLVEEIGKPRSTLCQGSLALAAGSGKHYSVTVRPMLLNGRDYAGKVVILSDITELMEMIGELNEKNSELSLVNRELREYSTTVEELAVERERSRLTRDIHDTLGQSMTVLNTVLQAALLSGDEDIAGIREKLSVASRIMKESMTELRKAVTGLKPGDLSPAETMHMLEILARGYEVSGVCVHLSLEGMTGNMPARYTAFLFRLCQEAITNSLRHGQAKNVDIILQNVSDRLRIFISDDGQGCRDAVKGQGLTGMEQRVAELTGRIWFGENEGSGFSIYVELPAKAS